MSKRVLALVMVLSMIFGLFTVSSFAATKPKTPPKAVATTFKAVSDIYGVWYFPTGNVYTQVAKTGVKTVMRTEGTLVFKEVVATHKLSEYKLSKDKKSITRMEGSGEAGFTYYTIIKKDKKGKVGWFADFDGEDLVAENRIFFKTVADLNKYVQKDKVTLGLIKKEKEYAASAKEREKAEQAASEFLENNFSDTHKFTGSFVTAEGKRLDFDGSTVTLTNGDYVVQIPIMTQYGILDSLVTEPKELIGMMDLTDAEGAVEMGGLRFNFASPTSFDKFTLFSDGNYEPQLDGIYERVK